MAGDDLVTCVNCRLEHLRERVWMVKDTRHVLKDCYCDLEEHSESDSEVSEVSILAICTALGTGPTPIGTREPAYQHAGETYQEFRPEMNVPDVHLAETARKVCLVGVSCCLGNVEGGEVPETKSLHGKAEATYTRKRLDITPAHGSGP